jgi:ankyrin repeat protein
MSTQYKASEQFKALWKACSKGNFREAERLIKEEGADVNDINSDGLSLLHLAVFGGYIKMAEFLIDNGADVNAINRGVSPLYAAVKPLYNPNPVMVKMLLSKGAIIEQKTIAAANAKGYTDIVEILEKWPLSMAILALQENQVYNQTGVDDLMDLSEYLGKKGEHYGGKRKNKKSNKRKSRKSKKSIKRRK